MKTERVLLYVIAILVLAVVGTHAQNIALTPSVLQIPSGAVSANCPVPSPNITTYCYSYDKLEVSGAGGAYVTVWPTGSVAQTVTINGVQKTLPASFTLSGTTTAPSIVSTATGPSTVIAAQ